MSTLTDLPDELIVMIFDEIRRSLEKEENKGWGPGNVPWTRSADLVSFK